MCVETIVYMCIVIAESLFGSAGSAPLLGTERPYEGCPAGRHDFVTSSGRPLQQRQETYVSLGYPFQKNSRPRQSWPRIRIIVVVFLAVTAIVGAFLMVARKVSAIDSPPSSSDPLSGIQMFVDPHNPAAQAEASLDRSDPAAASAAAKDREPTRRDLVRQPGTQLPSNLSGPDRNERGCGPSFRATVGAVRISRTGCTDRMSQEPRLERQLTSAGSARWWLGIGTGKAVVILEPDALAQDIRLDCLSPTEQRKRLIAIRRAVDQLATLPNTVVYIDAGNSRWQSAKVMASLLLAVDIGKVRGFSLNVSNFNSTSAEESYGDSVSAMLHGVHYVIDTSRNGTATAKTWCNPPGQALGEPPTARTGNPLVDALLWIKPPWASDGTCNGGPPAGMILVVLCTRSRCERPVVSSHMELRCNSCPRPYYVTPIAEIAGTRIYMLIAKMQREDSQIGKDGQQRQLVVSPSRCRQQTRPRACIGYRSSTRRSRLHRSGLNGVALSAPHPAPCDVCHYGHSRCTRLQLYRNLPMPQNQGHCAPGSPSELSIGP